jgi:hypothetical protein
VAICIHAAGPGAAFSGTSSVRGPRRSAPVRAAAVRTWAVPLRLALPFLAALLLRAAPAFLTAVPPLAAPAWAAIRAFRARLDFEAVIPSFASGDVAAGAAQSVSTQRERHLTPGLYLRLLA